METYNLEENKHSDLKKCEFKCSTIVASLMRQSQAAGDKSEHSNKL